jgi:Do/DeqQ family serine protease
MLRPLLAAALILAAAPSWAGAPFLDESRGVLTVAPIVEKTTPAVVNISVSGQGGEEGNPLRSDPFFRRFFGVPEPREEESQAAGSGVIVDAENGYVMTNHHVVEGVRGATVTLKDGRSFKARLVGSDPETDIALLRIQADRLRALSFGDSDALRVGDVVIAIGNPFGLGQTVTSGIVSALGRSGLGIEGYENFIQTDASINPGNSGGALINSKGELVGINTAIIGPNGGNVGIGFAVPANMARKVMAQLVEHGEVRRGIIGVVIQDVTPEIAEAMNLPRMTGALVAKVERNTPAETAGLKRGDVIVAVDGKEVRDADDLRNRIGLLSIGDTVRADYLRDGRQSQAIMKVEARKDAVASGGRSLGAPGEVPVFRHAGALFAPLLPGAPGYGMVEGALVLRVDPGSRAAAAGLERGDIVTAVGHQRVRGPDDLAAAIEGQRGPIPLLVVRGGRQVPLTIR